MMYLCYTRLNHTELHSNTVQRFRYNVVAGCVGDIAYPHASPRQQYVARHCGHGHVAGLLHHGRVLPPCVRTHIH